MSRICGGSAPIDAIWRTADPLRPWAQILPRPKKLAAANATPYLLVLLDANMPDQDGFAVAQHIRSHPQLTGATIICQAEAS